MEAPCPYIIRPYLNMKNNDDTSRMDDGVGTDKIIWMKLRDRRLDEIPKISMHN